jgi:ABC-type phosphate transport system substrate-binding protein
MSCRHFFAAVLLLTSGVSLAAARDLAVISNKTIAVSELTVAELAKVCKGQTSRWPDGKPVTFVMRPASAPETKLLLEKIYEMPDTAVNQLIATANRGRKDHPAIVVADSDDDLVNKVASIPGAIGVVDVYSINSSVTVVKVGGKLPLQPGYVLHGN